MRRPLWRPPPSKVGRKAWYHGGREVDAAAGLKTLPVCSPCRNGELHNLMALWCLLPVPPAHHSTQAAPGASCSSLWSSGIRPVKGVIVFVPLSTEELGSSGGHACMIRTEYPHVSWFLRPHGLLINPLYTDLPKALPSRTLKFTISLCKAPFVRRTKMASRLFIKGIPDNPKFLAPVAVAGTAKLRYLS